ncbi:hypothetical protein [Pelotomaculum propionicicum]|uniref:Uncharacterized protein n=1 Tax=Pelotomaculum propionicicum TaxID=258475 RepID=A0A4Y7RXE3_9FIRM|nr:hypothetical protein [Pelotomaculum propionicicum]TEB12957.1 hypothetical protein Pmgp_00595 [Pelotomaculum propionicicum]
MKGKAAKLIGSAILFGGVMLSAVCPALAAGPQPGQFRTPPGMQSQAACQGTTQSQFSETNAPPQGPGPGQGQQGQGFEELFSQLVTDGTLTQEEADAVIEALGQGQGARPDEIISQLVTDGVITQEQADAITQAFPQPPAPPADDNQE